MKRSDHRLTRLLDNLTGPVPKPKTDKTFRHEFKYLINRYDYLRCRNICERYMKYDKFAGADGTYFINSLYFDSVGYGDYFDKDLGAYDRKKMRIRNYGYDLDWAHFEMKRKIDIWEYKDKVRLSKDEVYKISSGDFSCLLNKGDDGVRFFAILTEGLYRPSCIVEYDRAAFVLPFEDVRVTFDLDVRYSTSDLDLFRKKVATPLFPEKSVVFEIKYNEFLPGWARGMLGIAGKQTEAVSKYCFARAKVL